MKIRWWSPLDSKKTEIARYSALILPYLKSVNGIDAVHDGFVDQEPPQWLRALLADGGSIAGRATSAPVDIYHIGNNAQHINIAAAARNKAGLVVLHDCSLLDLAKACEGFHWIDEIRNNYGDDGWRAVIESNLDTAAYNKLVTDFPLYMPFIENSLGVLVHSQHSKSVVQRFFRGPVRVLELPYPTHPFPTRRTFRSGRLKMVFCGHAGTNRRLESLIAAWGQLDDPQRFQLDIFGSQDDGRALDLVAEHAGVSDLVNVRGFVSEMELTDALASAHLAVNLRFPSMGETSASQLRLWDSALPALVSDVGWYKGLPDDTVLKISPDNEMADLKAALMNVLNNYDQYVQLGERGRDYLKNHHRPEDYAKGILQFASELTTSRLLQEVLDHNVVKIIADMCVSPEMVQLFNPAVKLIACTVESTKT